MDTQAALRGSSLSLAERIDRMHKRDRASILTFVVVLWATLIFALYEVWGYITVPQIKIILVVFGALILTFNTLAIFAMLRHYEEDKDFIYGLDLKNLDEMRSRNKM